MTFADVALGFSVVKALGGPHCATAQLQLQFIAAGRTGEFITCRPEIIRRTSQLVFVRGLVGAGERIVASADGIWKVLEPKSR
jgi:acyl-coenzyme A thioesterase PaaI-like protein